MHSVHLLALCSSAWTRLLTSNQQTICDGEAPSCRLAQSLADCITSARADEGLATIGRSRTAAAAAAAAAHKLMLQLPGIAFLCATDQPASC